MKKQERNHLRALRAIGLAGEPKRKVGARPELSGLYKPVAQPHVMDFREAFPDSAPWEFGKGWTPRFAPEIVGSMRVGPFCSVFNRGALAVRPADWVLSRIREHTVCVNGDYLGFEVIDHGNGFSLVLAKHPRILADVWLAYVRTETVPSCGGAS